MAWQNILVLFVIYFQSLLHLSLLNLLTKGIFLIENSEQIKTTIDIIIETKTTDQLASLGIQRRTQIPIKLHQEIRLCLLLKNHNAIGHQEKRDLDLSVIMQMHLK